MIIAPTSASDSGRHAQGGAVKPPVTRHLQSLSHRKYKANPSKTWTALQTCHAPAWSENWRRICRFCAKPWQTWSLSRNSLRRQVSAIKKDFSQNLARVTQQVRRDACAVVVFGA
jgi:hypothetical protein